jgi:TetR/AcrR family transcriptional regulator, fatty acid metabolism regulator protein
MANEICLPENHIKGSMLSMMENRTPTASRNESDKRPPPPGRIKIEQALRSLLETNDFNAITTATIAKTAGFTEALIYKYYKDKRDLLHQVLIGYNKKFLAQVERDQKSIRGSLNKLRKVIWSTLDSYATNRVYSKILLLEVRNYHDYFKSEAYEGLQTYGRILLDLIEEGVREGEIRNDIPPKFIRQVILGGIEYLCLPNIVFNKEFTADELIDDLCDLIFSGIQKTA